MAKTQLTKDQIISGIVAPFVKILAFALSFVEDKELVKEIVSETANQVNALETELQDPPTIEEVIEAVLEIAETAAETTPTEVDDAVIATAKSLASGGGFFAAIKGLISLNKAKKADKKSAENSAPAADVSSDAPAE